MRVLKTKYPNGKLEVYYLPNRKKGFADVDKVYMVWQIKGQKEINLNCTPGEALDMAIGAATTEFRWGIAPAIVLPMFVVP